MEAKRTGIAELRLAAGPVPHYREIVKISGPILAILVDEFGQKEVLKRFSDPIWLNCYSCAVGFEWQFSGMTTVPLKAAKEALEKENIGLKIVGGKGKESKATEQIVKIGNEFGFSTSKIEDLQKASKLTCKVDSCELQDGHQLYFHTMLIDEKGHYTTINQKMSIARQTVRRFHWTMDPKEFVEEPYSSIIGYQQKVVLDLTSKMSKECRQTLLDYTADTKYEKIQQTILMLSKSQIQTNLLNFLKQENIKVIKLPYYLQIPKKLNIEALKIANELKTKNFQDFLLIKGMGPATIRGLAYISNLIFGAKSSFKDPVKYTYAFGTKAGVPYMVDKAAMAEVADILKTALEESKLDKKEKMAAIKRLSRFVKF
jgi:hypothetical protein